MSIYRQLNPRLLVQVGVGLGLLHWTKMCECGSPGVCSLVQFQYMSSHQQIC